MPKKYKLLIDSPDISRGTVVTQEKDGSYSYQYTYTFSGAITEGRRFFQLHEVEDRPTVWQEIVEEPEKKIVERWRGAEGFNFFTLKYNFQEYMGETLQNKCKRYYDTGDYFRTEETRDRAKKRVEIMCRLMGLAETIEEGSTEMKGGYMLVSNDGNLYITHSYITYMSSMRLATFSTEKLAQLFLDSAGQDAIDWYGEVK